MVIFLTGLGLITLIAAALLAIVRVGIRRQERCRCLACQPPSLAASLTRRLIGLSVSRAAPSACHRVHAHQNDGVALVEGARFNHVGIEQPEENSGPARVRFGEDSARIHRDQHCRPNRFHKIGLRFFPLTTNALSGLPPKYLF